MVVHDAASGETVAIDYREMSGGGGVSRHVPRRGGRRPTRRSRATAGLAVGVPGTVAGMALALERYGTLSLAEALAPAIALAADGIAVSADLADSLKAAADAAAAMAGERPRSSTRTAARLTRPASAWSRPTSRSSLRLIAEQGPAAFYGGPLGERIVAAVGSAGGHLTIEDLKAYQAMVRAPVRGSYRGYEILSMPPPSSGGVHIIQILNIARGRADRLPRRRQRRRRST